MTTLELRRFLALGVLPPIMGGMEADSGSGGDGTEGDGSGSGDGTETGSLGGLDLGLGGVGANARGGDLGAQPNSGGMGLESVQTGALGGAINTGLAEGQAPSQETINAALQQDINAGLAGLQRGDVQNTPPPSTGGPTYGSLGAIPGVGGYLQKGLNAITGPLTTAFDYLDRKTGGNAFSGSVGDLAGFGGEGGGATGQGQTAPPPPVVAGAPTGTAAPGQGQPTPFTDPLAWLRNLGTTGSMGTVDTGTGATAGATPGTAASGAAGAGTPGTDPMSKLVAAYDLAIPYMQSPNLLSTTEGQAVRESIVGNIRAQYEQQKQQVLQRAAAMGLGPSSGAVQDQLAQLDRQFQSDQSSVDRQFEQTYYTRLTDSLTSLTNLVNLDDSRNAAALGQAMAVDESQRQAIMDVMNVAGLGSADMSNAAAISGGILNYATGLGNRYLALQGNAYNGLGAIAQGVASGGFNTGSGASGSPTSLGGIDPMLYQQLFPGGTLNTNPLVTPDQGATIAAA